MIKSNASPQDFIRWAKHAKTCSYQNLQSIIADCDQARLAMSGWNPEREGYYCDQASVYAIELRNRKNNN